MVKLLAVQGRLAFHDENWNSRYACSKEQTRGAKEAHKVQPIE